MHFIEYFGLLAYNVIIIIYIVRIFLIFDYEK